MGIPIGRLLALTVNISAKTGKRLSILPQSKALLESRETKGGIPFSEISYLREKAKGKDRGHTDWKA